MRTGAGADCWFSLTLCLLTFMFLRLPCARVSYLLVVIYFVLRVLIHFCLT